MTQYLKLIVALGTTGLITLQTVLSDNAMTGSEWVTVGLAALGAAGVYLARNEPAVEVIDDTPGEHALPE